MQKIVYEKHEELIPENTYLTDLEESDVYTLICAKHIDESLYKDITDEEAEIIIKRNTPEDEEINEEVEDNGKEEN